MYQVITEESDVNKMSLCNTLVWIVIVVIDWVMEKSRSWRSRFHHHTPTTIQPRLLPFISLYYMERVRRKI